ncbi:MAG: PEP-CTERM sorting domain-containing protein [Verrucomicrobiales bacterium]|nr:PEP-CTERM sorting domain-containing protein [Verrucomicrobiales bacterium]
MPQPKNPDQQAFGLKACARLSSIINGAVERLCPREKFLKSKKLDFSPAPVYSRLSVYPRLTIHSLTMKRTLKFFSCVAAGMAVGLIGHAQFYTIWPGGPSGYAPDTIYIPSNAPPTTGSGAHPLLTGPPPPNPPADLYVVDALSSGWDAGGTYLFSVRFGAIGLPGSSVEYEVTNGTPLSQFFPGPPGTAGLPPEAEGDLFSITGPVFGLPALAGPLAFSPVVQDEYSLGLNVGGMFGSSDDLSGVTHRLPLPGNGFYYSLAAFGLGLSGARPADILNINGIWALSIWLGLDSLGLGTDDIDALLVQDLGTPGRYDPGVDFVAFSLTPGSATLTISGPGYAPGGGDLLVPDGPDPDNLPDIFIPAAAFGLKATDNLDAVDVVPEPSAVLVLLAGLGLLLIRRRG